MDRSPPPFFNQGAPAHLRVLFFACLAIALLIADARFGMLNALRQGLAAVLNPVQKTLLVPRDALEMGGDYVGQIASLRAENETLKRVEVANARALLQAEQLAADNARLRALLGAREKAALRSVMAEVLYETRDPFTRRVVLDKGTREGVLEGMPVIDPRGVVGQVTRAFAASSEVTLVTDRSMAVPVESQRSGARSILFGAGEGELELRYLANSIELKPGEVWMTSGLDGIYPPGLPVARVKAAPSSRDTGFTRNSLEPVADVERARALLILLVDRSALPAPAPPGAGLDKPKRKDQRGLNTTGVSP